MKSIHKNLLLAGVCSLSLIACGGGGGDSSEEPTSSGLEGLAECVASPTQSVVCGSVLATDGVTPLVGAEVSMSGTKSLINTPRAGVADPDKCVTDISGEFACLLPDGTAGTISLVISAAGFDDQTFSADAVTGDTIDTGVQQLTGNTEKNWVVIPGIYDGVQLLLSQLKGCVLNDVTGNPFDPLLGTAENARASDDCTSKGLLVLNIDDDTSPTYAPTFLTNGSLAEYDSLFVNCPVDYSTVDGANAALQEFVAAGKHAYFSDLSDSWLTSAFPGKVNFAGGSTSTGDITANVVSPGLSTVVGNTVDIALDLPFWSAIDSVEPGVTTFIEGDISTVSDITGVHPITVGWKNDTNSGCVFYTSYHIEGASMGSDQEVAIKYMVQNISSVCQ